MTFQTLLDTLMTNGGIDRPAADRVIALYRKMKVLKYNAHDGYQIKHGGLFDRKVIRNATLFD